MNMNENKRRRSMLLYILIAIVAYLAISQAIYPNLRATQITSVTYSEFLNMVDNNEVEKVDLNTGDNTLQFTTGEGESEKHYETTMWPYDDTLIQRLDEHGVDANATIPDTSGDIWLMLLVSYGLPILFFLGIGWWLNRRMKKAMGDDGPSMNFGGGFGGGGLGKSNAKEIKGEDTRHLQGRGRSGRGQGVAPGDRELPQEPREVQRDRCALPARRPARGPSGHR